MSKRFKSVLAASMAALLVIAGCSSGGKGKENADDGNAASGQAGQSEKAPVTLKLWGAVPEENGPAAVVEKWNRANPDIQVEYVRYINDPSGNTKLDTALMTQSDAPDIFISYGEDNLFRRINANMTTPLDEFIRNADFDVDGIIGEANILKHNGEIHYLPAYKNIDFVVLNKQALDEIGEPVPTDWTWDDFLELAAKLNKGDRKGAFITPGADMLIGKFTLVSSQPKDAYYTADGMSNLDHPAMKKGLEIQKSLYDQGLMVGWGEAIATKLDASNELLTGKAAMVYGGAWMMRNLKDTEKWPRDFAVAFAPAPQYEKGTNVNNGGMNDFLSINRNSRHKEEAFKFIAWYLTEGNIDMIPGGRIPTNRQADFDQVTELIVGDKKDIIDAESLSYVLKADYTFAIRENMTAYPQITNIMKEEAEKYFMGEQSVDEALAAMKSRADRAIQEESQRQG